MLALTAGGARAELGREAGGEQQLQSERKRAGAASADLRSVVGERSSGPVAATT